MIQQKLGRVKRSMEDPSLCHPDAFLNGGLLMIRDV